MKERGVIFNAEMVRALLSGNKTQTRRPVNPDYLVENGDVFKSAPFNRKYIGGLVRVTCPFGQVGDRIWVRETLGSEIRNVGGTPHEKFVYRASKPEAVHCYDCNGNEIPMKWTPSIHMPRSASRITLEITDIRVERLHDISEKDAISEGVERVGSDTAWKDYLRPGIYLAHAVDSYISLWNSIYGNWDENPWVYVISFKRVEA